MSTQSERIKSLILNSGKSYQELERITGIKKSSLQRYASGATAKIPLEVIEKLSSVFHVSKDYLTGWEPIGDLVYHCPDDENPYEVNLRDAFDKLELEDQIYVSKWVESYAENGNSPSQMELTEGERALLELFRLVPEDRQPMVLSMIKAALCTGK